MCLAEFLTEISSSGNSRPSFDEYPLFSHTKLLNLFKNILQVVKRTQWNALSAHDTIRTCEVKVEIGDYIFAHVSLAREAEVSHLALHYNLLVLFAVDDFRVYTL